MKNRKTITFDQDILNISKALEPEERKEFFLQLVEHFLEDKQFPDTVSPCLKVALAAASPTIRKLQSKFLNGKCTKDTSCPKNASETKPTEANAPAHMYNNQSTNKNKISSSINFNTTNQPTNVINNTNIYNNISTYINYLKNNQNLSVEQIKNPLNYERRVSEALNQLRTQEPQTFLNFNNTFDYVLKNEIIKITGASHSQQEVVSVILELLIKPDGIQTIRELSSELDSTLRVRNKSAYFLTMLWNRAKNLSQTVQQNKSKPNFKQRTYTKEQCDAFYDNLDDIDV